MRTTTCFTTGGFGTPIAARHFSDQGPAILPNAESQRSHTAHRAREAEPMRLRYAVVFERLPDNYGAYVPDLPGCISTSETWNEMQQMIREAISFHIEGMLEDGEPVPEARMSVREAMTYHAGLLSENGGAVTEADTTIAMVEVDVPSVSAGAITA